MADPRRRPNAITWVAPPEPEPRRAGRLGPCGHCRSGAHHQPALGRDGRRSFKTEKLGG